MANQDWTESRSQYYAAKCFLKLAFCVVSLLTSLVRSEESATIALHKSWTLFHSANRRDFAPRASITLNVEGRAGDASDESSKSSPPTIQLNIANRDECLTEALVQSMLNPGWYQLKLMEDDADGPGRPMIVTSVPACQVRRSNFRDEIVLSFGMNATVLSIGYIPLMSPLAPLDCANLPLLPEAMTIDGASPQFQSKVSWEASAPGKVLRTTLPSYPPPPGLKLISATRAQAGGGPGGPEGDGGPPPPPQDTSMFGFLKRYWYILVPLFLSNLMSADPPQQPAPPGGGQQQQQAGGGTATPASPQAGGNTNAAAVSPGGGANATAKGVRAKRSKRG